MKAGMQHQVPEKTLYFPLPLKKKENKKITVNISLNNKDIRISLLNNHLVLPSYISCVN
jgi:hypothetical protein